MPRHREMTMRGAGGGSKVNEQVWLDGPPKIFPETALASPLPGSRRLLVQLPAGEALASRRAVEDGGHRTKSGSVKFSGGVEATSAQCVPYLLRQTLALCRVCPCRSFNNSRIKLQASIMFVSVDAERLSFQNGRLPCRQRLHSPRGVPSPRRLINPSGAVPATKGPLPSVPCNARHGRRVG